MALRQPRPGKPTWAPRTTGDRVILALFILLMLFLVHKAYVQSQDFRVFYTAARRLMAGEEIYRFSDGANPFKYWPGFAYLMVPLALLPVKASQTVWAAVNVAALYASLVLVVGPLFPTKRYHIAFWSTMLTMQPITDHFMDGQINLLLLAMILAGFTLIGRGGSRAAGGTTLLVTAAAVKLYPAAFLVMLPLKLAWRQVAVAAAVVVGLLALPILLGGIESAAHQYRGWWAIVADSGNHLDLSQTPNQSLLGMYLRILSDDGLAIALYRATAAAVLLVTLLGLPRTPLRRVDKRFVMDFTMVACAMLLVSPLTWTHYYVFLLPFTVVIVGELAFPQTRKRLAWVGLGLILISALPTRATLGMALRDAVFSYSNHVFELLLVLGYCIYRRRLGPDADQSATSGPTECAD